MLLSFDAFTHDLHGKAMQVLNQAGQHFQSMMISSGLVQQRAIELDYVIRHCHESLKVALQGTEIITRDMCTMTTQNVEQISLLPIERSMLQDFKPDLDSQLALFQQDPQQQLLRP